jgi:nitrogen fixation protein FixH
MRLVAIVAAALLYALPAAAQHSHGAKGPNGGKVEDVAGVHAELVTAGTTVTFNILDENNKPVSIQGYSGSVLIVSGADRETVTLAPAGESALKGEAKKAVAANASVTLMLKTDKGKTGQARYAK